MLYAITFDSNKYTFLILSYLRTKLFYAPRSGALKEWVLS